MILNLFFKNEIHDIDWSRTRDLLYIKFFRKINNVRSTDTLAMPPHTLIGFWEMEMAP